MVFLISCFCYSACLGAKAPGALVCTLNGRDASWLLAMGLALWCDNQAHKRLVVLGCVVGAWWWCLENAQWITQSLWSLVTRNENRWHVSVNITLDSFWSTARTESLASALYGAPRRGWAQVSKQVQLCELSLHTVMPSFPLLAAASGLLSLPMSTSWSFSFTTSQCPWLPTVPTIVFLQYLRFIPGLPSPLGSVLDKWEIPVVEQEN